MLQFLRPRTQILFQVNQKVNSFTWWLFIIYMTQKKTKAFGEECQKTKMDEAAILTGIFSE